VHRQDSVLTAQVDSVEDLGEESEILKGGWIWHPDLGGMSDQSDWEVESECTKDSFTGCRANAVR
jgi:hypothetical protein